MASNWINRSWYPELKQPAAPSTEATEPSGTATSSTSTEGGTETVTEEPQTTPAYSYGGGGGGNDYAISYQGDQGERAEPSVLSDPFGWLDKTVPSYQAVSRRGGTGYNDGGAWWNPQQGQGVAGGDNLSALQEMFRRLMGTLSTTGRSSGLGWVGNTQLPWYLRQQAQWR